MSFKFSLGVYVNDRVSGLNGCITDRADSLTGVNRYCVTPLSVDNHNAQWFDEKRLTLYSGYKLKIEDVGGA